MVASPNVRGPCYLLAVLGLTLCIGIVVVSSHDAADDMVPETFAIQNGVVHAPHVSLEQLRTSLKNDSLLDIDDMMDESEANAKAELNTLKAQKPAEKAKWDKAKRDFRNCRENVRDNFVKCMDTITKANPTLENPACQLFTEEMPHAASQEVVQFLDTSEEGVLAVTMEEVGGRRRRERKKQKKAAKKQAKKEKKTAKKEKKTAKKEKKTAKKEYKTEKKGKTKDEKKELKKEYKDAKKDAKEDKKDAKEDKKAAKQKKKAAKCEFGTRGKQKRCAQKALRKMKRDSKRQCRASKRAAKSEWKDFKGRLRSAWMNVYLLPKVLAMAKPSLEKAIADMDVVGESQGATGDAAVALENVSAKACVQGTIEEFVSLKLQTTLAGPFFLVIAKLRSALFKVIDTIMESIKAALVGSVGSIPFVGGALAVAVGGAVSLVTIAIKGGIFVAFSKIYKLLLTSTVTGIMALLFPAGKMNMAYFPGGKFDPSGSESQFKQAAVTGPKSFQDETKQTYTKKALASQEAAANAPKEVVSEGNKQSREYQEEEVDDAACDKQADQYDDAHDDYNDADDD